MIKKVVNYIWQNIDVLIFCLSGWLLIYVTTLDVIISEAIFFKCVFFISAALWFQYLIPKPFRQKIIIMPLAVGLFYILPIPVIACITGQILNCHHDIFFGMYLTLFIGNIRELLISPENKRKEKALLLIFGVFCAILTLPPIVNLVHYNIYGINISEASVFAVLDTDLHESLEYVKSYFRLYHVLLFAAAFIGFPVLLEMFDYVYINKFQRFWKANEKKTYIFFSLTALAALLVFSLFQKTLLMRLYRSVKQYRAEALYFQESNRKIEENIKPVGPISETPSTVILVIGESASRDYMRAFAPDFRYCNTPWLSKMKENPNFLLFSNAYACSTQTVSSLTQVLTEASQYNNKTFVNSATLINVAKKLDYTTYWFTKQGLTGIYDANITMIAETSDYFKGRSGGDVGYDHDLIQQFKATKYGSKNFIVFHLMGSHINFADRYPPNWEFFNGGRSAEYANSILYTDSFLKQVYEYAKERLNLSVMIYFSDHGEDYAAERHPDIFNIHTIRIPFFVYLSPQYQKEHPERFHRLSVNKNKYFTNDMLYNTVCGLLSAKINRYNKSEDISSDAYIYNERNIRSLNKPIRLF